MLSAQFSSTMTAAPSSSVPRSAVNMPKKNFFFFFFFSLFFLKESSGGVWPSLGDPVPSQAELGGRRDHPFTANAPFCFSFLRNTMPPRRLQIDAMRPETLPVPIDADQKQWWAMMSCVQRWEHHAVPDCRFIDGGASDRSVRCWWGWPSDGGRRNGRAGRSSS